jgi:Arc-like DNA binding domain
MQYIYPTSVRLPKQLKDYLQRRAAQEDRKMASVIVRILEESRVAFTKKKYESDADRKVEQK